MEEEIVRQGRSLAETPTYSVASVVTVLVFVCFFVQRAIYRFGKWLKKTKRKALFASLEKIKEGIRMEIRICHFGFVSVIFALELMLLGLISLLLAQWARGISEICVNSSLLSSKFYICSEKDYGINKNSLSENSSSFLNESDIPPKGINFDTSHQCGEGREPFVSLEGLEQLHRFLFVLGITHVLYSCVAVGLSMSKIYSWRKWENQARLADIELQALMLLKNASKENQSDATTDHVRIPSHVSSLEQESGSHMDDMRHEDESRLLLEVHNQKAREVLGSGILVMLVGTKLEHVVSSLALEIMEQTGQPIGTQVKPRDDLFWFRKPEILMPLRWQHFYGHWVLVQFWCSYSTVPLNVIVTQMGSRFKKTLVSESVRESLHSWCKRVKERSKHDSSLHSHTTRSVCSLDTTTIDERDEITVASGTLSRSSSMESLNQVTITSTEQAESILHALDHPQAELSFRVEEYLNNSASQPPITGTEDFEEDNSGSGEGEEKVETLYDLFRKT
ncbi:hypothetical protein JRO89_XS02G0217400 [Xanthoceras sorbifolium]|uniref:MLO-like protein n=1 Tax=Xanthoceras sorbifolium TaxID=99658 RepID=A0ABQ8IGI2_9ROSI|nr:hypothetical protein JRO89_XS02G0217400 [Xanthoceras sorbifolium]